MIFDLFAKPKKPATKSKVMTPDAPAGIPPVASKVPAAPPPLSAKDQERAKEELRRIRSQFSRTPEVISDEEVIRRGEENRRRNLEMIAARRAAAPPPAPANQTATPEIEPPARE